MPSFVSLPQYGRTFTRLPIRQKRGRWLFCLTAALSYAHLRNYENLIDTVQTSLDTGIVPLKSTHGGVCAHYVLTQLHCKWLEPLDVVASESGAQLATSILRSCPVIASATAGGGRWPGWR